jgi:hypothetical protein
VFTVGSSPFAKLLEIAKRRIAAIPNITLAYLDSILSAHGAQVRVLDVRGLDQLAPADLYLISSSIVDCSFEREIGFEVRRRFGAKVGYFGTFAATVPEFFAEAADFTVQEEIENIAPALARGEIHRNRGGRIRAEPDASLPEVISLCPALQVPDHRHGITPPCSEAGAAPTRATTARTRELQVSSTLAENMDEIDYPRAE